MGTGADLVVRVPGVVVGRAAVTRGEVENLKGADDEEGEDMRANPSRC